MAFPWYQSNLPAQLTSTFAPTADESIRNEVRNRAGLLMRLGYGEKEVAERIGNALAWEFELGGKPTVLKEVGALVGAVYGRTQKKK